LEQALANPNRILLIAECDEKPVGVVRFDVTRGVATISVYRVPALQRRSIGLIRGATQWLRETHRDVTRIVAEIRADNTASYEGFRAAGFQETKRELATEIKR
jgi:hypothetical protein